MKIKHLLLSVFLAFAAASATAQDERVLQIPGHENPLKLETLRERMIAKTGHRFVKDVVIVSIRRSYNPFTYLASLMSDEIIIKYYVELEIRRGSEWSYFDGCEMQLNRSTSSKYLIHLKECFTESGSPWWLWDLFFYRDELGLTG